MTNLFIVRQRVMPFAAGGSLLFNIVHRRQVVAVAGRADALRIARLLTKEARVVTRACGHVEHYPHLAPDVRHTFEHTACHACRLRFIEDLPIVEADFEEGR